MTSTVPDIYEGREQALMKHALLKSNLQKLNGSLLLRRYRSGRQLPNKVVRLRRLRRHRQPGAAVQHGSGFWPNVIRLDLFESLPHKLRKQRI